MSKNKKIFLISLVFLFFIFLNSNCFAYTDTEGYSNEDMYNMFTSVKEELEENNTSYYDYVIVSHCKNDGENDNSVEIYMFLDSDYSCYVSNYYNTLRLHANKCNVYCFSNGSFTFSVVSKQNNITAYGKAVDIKYSSFLIKNKDGTDFFSQTPLTRLVPVVKQVEMGETMKQIIQLFPMILVVVVSCLGLRKALQMLLTVLHQS